MSEVNVNLNKFIIDTLPTLIHDGLEKSGQLVENEAKLELSSGGNRAIDTGDLRASIDYVMGDNEVIIGTNVEYAPFVHDGTFKMDGRPFLQDAVDKNIQNIINCFKG